jgi:hypothetical protein
MGRHTYVPNATGNLTAPMTLPRSAAELPAVRLTRLLALFIFLFFVFQRNASKATPI